MKASEFEVLFSSGLFTCCLSHIEECDTLVHEGSVITCDHCGLDMTLQKVNGKLMWVNDWKGNAR